MKCCVCNRKRTVHKRIEIRPDERVQLEKMTNDPIPEAYEYCKACWSVISDRQQGAQLLKGLLHVGLQSNGVRNPGTYANKYYDFFVSKSKGKP